MTNINKNKMNNLKKMKLPWVPKWAINISKTSGLPQIYHLCNQLLILSSGIKKSLRRFKIIKSPKSQFKTMIWIWIEIKSRTCSKNVSTPVKKLLAQVVAASSQKAPSSPRDPSSPTRSTTPLEARVQPLLCPSEDSHAKMNLWWWNLALNHTLTKLKQFHSSSTNLDRRLNRAGLKDNKTYMLFKIRRRTITDAFKA
jgi:hypothetical protein